MGNYKIIGICLLSFAIIFITAIAIKGAGRFIFKSILNMIMGIVLLIGLNWCGKYLGFTLSLNFVNAFVIGFLGIPGFGLIIALQYILK